MGKAYAVEGACHCKAIQFTCAGFDPTEVDRCSCTLCTKSGRLSFKTLDDDAFKIKQDDGTYAVLNFNTVSTACPSALRTYTPSSGSSSRIGQVNQHFCAFCGVEVLMTENLSAWPKIFVNVNVLTVDLAKVGLDLKTIAKPEKITYWEGRNDTWEKRKGEPYEQGLW